MTDRFEGHQLAEEQSDMEGFSNRPQWSLCMTIQTCTPGVTVDVNKISLDQTSPESSVQAESHPVSKGFDSTYFQHHSDQFRKTCILTVLATIKTMPSLHEVLPRCI